MKATIFSVLILCSLLLVSCHKEKHEKKICAVSECSVCMDERFQNNDEIDGYAPNFLGDRIIERTIIVPLVRESSCNYIVSGIIKYTDVRNGETVALLDYGDGTVDAWAVKTIYPPKNEGGICGNGGGHGGGPSASGCFAGEIETGTTCCKFEQKCSQVLNAAISKEPITQNTAVDY